MNNNNHNVPYDHPPGFPQPNMSMNNGSSTDIRQSVPSSAPDCNDAVSPIYIYNCICNCNFNFNFIGTPISSLFSFGQ